MIINNQFLPDCSVASPNDAALGQYLTFLTSDHERIQVSDWSIILDIDCDWTIALDLEFD